MKEKIVLAIVRFLIKGAPGFHIHRDPGRKREANKEGERICKEAAANWEDESAVHLRSQMENVQPSAHILGKAVEGINREES